MAYNNNIPQPSTNLSQSQADLLANFTALDTAYGTAGDHVAFSVTTDAGKHKKSTYPEQSPAPTTGVNEMAVYSAANAAVSDLYVRRENDGTTLNITNNTLAATSGAGTTVDGLQFRAGQSGFINGSATKAIAFGTAFPNGFVSAVATIDTATPILLQITTASTAGFSVVKQTTSGSQSFYWIAIGY